MSAPRRALGARAAAVASLALLWLAFAPATVGAQHGDAHGAAAHEASMPDTMGDEAIEAIEHEDHGHGPVTIQDVFSSTAFWATVINFVIFAFLLTRLARKPVSEFLTTRRKDIEVGLAEGKRLKAEAEATKAEYEARMAELDDELEALRAEIVRSGEKERDRLKAEAEERAARMRRDAEFAIEQRVKQLRQDLTEETVNAALLAAKKLLRDAMTAEDQRRLADGYLAKLQERVRASIEDGVAS